MKTLLEIIHALKAEQAAKAVGLACLLTLAAPRQLLHHLGVSGLVHEHRAHLLACAAVYLAWCCQKTARRAAVPIRKHIHRTLERARTKHILKRLADDEHKVIAMFQNTACAELELDCRAQAVCSLQDKGILIRTGNGVLGNSPLAETARFRLAPTALQHLHRQHHTL